MGSADVGAQSKEQYAKTNMLYAAKSLSSLQTAVRTSCSLSLVLDEARVSNSKMLQVFASSPLTFDTPQGMSLAPQIREELHVDLSKKSLGIRIEEAISAVTAARAARHGKPVNGTAGQGRSATGAAGRKKQPSRPKADPLMATHELCLSLDNALQLIFPGEGLKRFVPKRRQLSRLVSPEGTYVFMSHATERRWMLQTIDEDGAEVWRKLLPGESAWRSSPPPVLTITADQGPENFAMYVNLAFHEGLRIVYFPDINHVEGNVDSGLLEALDMPHIDAKSKFLCRLHYGPTKGEGHWHAQIKSAFKADHYYELLTTHNFPTADPAHFLGERPKQYIIIFVIRGIGGGRGLRRCRCPRLCGHVCRAYSQGYGLATPHVSTGHQTIAPRHKSSNLFNTIVKTAHPT